MRKVVLVVNVTVAAYVNKVLLKLVSQIQHATYRNNKVQFMKFLNSKLLLSSVFASAALFASVTHADDNKLQQAYKSTNVKGALINLCKDETAKGNKLSAAEVSKYCTCAVEADGKMTNAQKWEIQSAINAKKSPSSLAFVQQQNKNLQTCFGPQLTTKLKTLSEEAMKAAPAAKN